MMRRGYCSNCGVVLLIPLPGAQVITCAICQAKTGIYDPPEAPPHPASQKLSSPSPYNHAPPGPPPSAHGPKKAVICGIVYRNSDHELKGCIDDAKSMRQLCIGKFNFPESSIIMLTEDETDPSKLPTKKNMRTALSWLVQGCQPGDSLLFYFAGHGSRQRNDINGAEVDGYDETLCPLDFETEREIVDDEINDTIVKPLPRGAKLHAIVDACRSGTVLDLPFLCRMGRTGQHVWEDHRPRNGVWKGTKGGEAISFSGCDDDQSSRELSKITTLQANALSDRSRTTAGGIMTIAFIDAIEELGVEATYGSILNSTRNNAISLTIANAIKSFLNGGSLGGRVYNTLIGERYISLGDAIKSVVGMLHKYGSSAGRSVGRRESRDRDLHCFSRQVEIQEPQLTSNYQFDIHAKRFSP